MRAELCDVYLPDFPAAPASTGGPGSAAGPGAVCCPWCAAGRGPAGISGSAGDPGPACAPGDAGGLGSFVEAERLLEAGYEEVENQERHQNKTLLAYMLTC